MRLRDKRKKKYIGTSIQKKTLILVFASAVIPSAIIGTCLYYLIFNMMAWQLAIPEAIAYNLFPVAQKLNLIILISLPITLTAIWLVALELSHRIAGPLYRLERELDERIAGTKEGPIRLRDKDELKPLGDRINKLLSKLR